MLLFQNGRFAVLSKLSAVCYTNGVGVHFYLFIY
jgi:hypothetical protein